jgi:hypothetical protein
MVCFAGSEHVVKLLKLLYASVSFFSLIVFFVLIEGIVIPSGCVSCRLHIHLVENLENLLTILMLLVLGTASYLNVCLERLYMFIMHLVIELLTEICAGHIWLPN